MCIVAGIVVAAWLTHRRWEARGGRRDDVIDVATWAVPFGIVGGRIYHVITDPELYFPPGQQPIRAFVLRGRHRSGAGAPSGSGVPQVLHFAR